MEQNRRKSKKRVLAQFEGRAIGQSNRSERFELAKIIGAQSMLEKEAEAEKAGKKGNYVNPLYKHRGSHNKT